MENDMTRFEPSPDETFLKRLQTGTILVDFTAPWCDPCKSQEGVLEKIEAIYQGRVLVQRVNIDEHPGVALTLGVQSIPTLILFQQGHELHRFIGLQPIETLLNSIEPILDD